MEFVPAVDILVIEDDADTQANLSDILELDQYRVESAYSARQALARDDWGRFGAIVLDRRLPDANADELLPALRKAAPQAAVIVVTGYADIQGAIAALRLGAADYILKPIDPEALRASLNRVAERRRLALAKQRSEAAFRLLVEAAECMIVILRPDRTIAYLNPFAERLTGYQAAEVAGHDFFSLFLPETDRAAMAQEFARVLENRPSSGYQSPIVGRDGARRWVVWNSRLLSVDEGAPAVLVVGQDITGLRQAQQQALRTERLAAIGQMVAGLAHESRNALQRSQACLEMLALTVPDRPEALDLIARVQHAQDDLQHLYEDVRNYAAPIVLDRRPCDLGELWRETWSHLDAARTGKQASLRELVDGVDLRCSVDPFRLSQVMRNILENALAAGRPPIEVEVRAAPVELEGQPAIQLSFRDNGPGLDPGEKRRIFEPFYTTKAKGTGLGLAIAKRIVEAHDGQIALGDGPPGAEFLITIPRGMS
jgi:PAS domain S-box-containing protein